MTTIDRLPLKMAKRIQLEPHPFVGLSPYCWVWTGGRTTGGYGLVGFNGKRYYTHRLAYTLLSGEIPEGLQIDHLCRNRACCNPSHLEPVTNRTNCLRGIKAQRTHCVHGHPLSGDNLVWSSQGEGRPRTRRCRTCANASGRRAWQLYGAERNAVRRATYVRAPARPAGVCINGHDVNQTGVYKRGNGQTCAQCSRDRCRRYKARKRAGAASTVIEASAS